MKQNLLIDSANNHDLEAIKNYLDYTSKFSESPPMFHLATYLQTVSCVVGRARCIVQGEDRIYPNQYTLIVAPSSLFKKTSSINLLKKWLSRLSMMNGYIGQIGSMEGLFGGFQENNGSVVSLYSEGGELLAAAKKKWMPGFLEMLNDLYDCPDYYRKRLAAGVQTAKDVCFNLIAASQLDSLTKHVREGDLLSGFLPRFAVIFADKLGEHMVRRPVPDINLQNKILSRLHEIKKACKESKEMDLTPEAWDFFENWGQDKYKQAVVAPPTIQPMYGRLESHALKAAILIHLTRYPEETDIDLKSTRAACNHANLILEGYRRLILDELTFTVNEHKLKRVSDLIKNAGTLSHRDVANATRYPRRELTELLQTLVDMGRVKAEAGIKGGKIWKWMGRNM